MKHLILGYPRAKNKWSCLERALKKNGKGFLYSSDFPYFRLKNPEQYIGYLAKDEINKKDWFLDIRGDDIALSEIMRQLNSNSIDLFHYDSDKSYSGRNKALNTINSNVNEETIIKGEHAMSPYAQDCLITSNGLTTFLVTDNFV